MKEQINILYVYIHVQYITYERLYACNNILIMIHNLVEVSLYLMSHTLIKESIAHDAKRLGSVNDQPTSLEYRMTKEKVRHHNQTHKYVHTDKQTNKQTNKNTYTHYHKTDLTGLE